MWGRKLLAFVLNLLAMSVLLLGACVGPGLLYVQSPKWSLEPYDADKSRTFFVAFRAKTDKGKEGTYVALYRRDLAKAGYIDIRYQLPEGRIREDDNGEDLPATIIVKNESGGSQLVTISVTGDTPWSSLSEYRVKDNTVEPLRHGHSNAWWLLGILLCLVGVHYAMKPIARSVDRKMGLKEELPLPPPA